MMKLTDSLFAEFVVEVLEATRDKTTMKMKANISIEQGDPWEVQITENDRKVVDENGVNQAAKIVSAKFRNSYVIRAKNPETYPELHPIDDNSWHPSSEVCRFMASRNTYPILFLIDDEHLFCADEAAAKKALMASLKSFDAQETFAACLDDTPPVNPNPPKQITEEANQALLPPVLQSAIATLDQPSTEGVA